MLLHGLDTRVFGLRIMLDILNVFPEMDFYMCTKLNKFDFVLKLNKENAGIAYIEKISN